MLTGLQYIEKSKHSVPREQKVRREYANQLTIAIELGKRDVVDSGEGEVFRCLLWHPQLISLVFGAILSPKIVFHDLSIGVHYERGRWTTCRPTGMGRIGEKTVSTQSGAMAPDDGCIAGKLLIWAIEY